MDERQPPGRTLYWGLHHSTLGHSPRRRHGRRPRLRPRPMTEDATRSSGSRRAVLGRLGLRGSVFRGRPGLQATATSSSRAASAIWHAHVVDRLVHAQHHDHAPPAIEAWTPPRVGDGSTAAARRGAERSRTSARAARGCSAWRPCGRRLQPAVAHLRDLVAAGDIGEVLVVQADFGAQRDFDPGEPALRPRARWRLDPRPRRLPDLPGPAPHGSPRLA